MSMHEQFRTYIICSLLIRIITNNAAMNLISVLNIGCEEYSYS